MTTPRRSWTRLAGGAALLLLAGCAQQPILVPANDRPFEFERDAFAFANEVEWNYYVDPRLGITEPVSENPQIRYSQRCFVLSRSARQFFQFARFDPRAARLDEAGYRERIRAVIARDPSRRQAEPRIAFPGYASLRDFSRDWSSLLKAELGGAALSYLQRGNWRMVFPFTRGHQERTAETLAREIRVNRPPVVHLAAFPSLNINHAVLLYDVRETPAGLRFYAYDPNDPRAETPLVYDRDARRFRFATTAYFAGGPVNVYEVYRSLLY